MCKSLAKHCTGRQPSLIHNNHHCDSGSVFKNQVHNSVTVTELVCYVRSGNEANMVLHVASLRHDHKAHRLFTHPH